VTQQIIADLQRGVRPWTRPWSAGHPAGPVARPVRHNLQPYGGINVLLLWAEAVRRGFSAPVWMTYRQALVLGGQVRRGEHGATVVYAHQATCAEADEDGEAAARQVRFLKAYTVFNLDQIDGLACRFKAPETAPLDADQRIARAEAFFAATGAEIRHGGDAAYYLMAEDRIQLPPFERFVDAQGYYATLAHECAHWTRHPRRLDRDFGRHGFGKEAYAREELVAELGSAFLCADLGLELTPRADHTAYIQHWLKVLAQDRRFIFTAAAHAQRAADYLHGLQPQGGAPSPSP
jgi:antirestriction protein ArdC